MVDYNLDAMNACMRKVQDHQPRFGSIADEFPQACTSPAVYGELPSSAAVSRAVDELNEAMHGEFEAAESRLGQVARALDAVVQSVQNTEDSNVRALTPR